SPWPARAHRRAGATAPPGCASAATTAGYRHDSTQLPPSWTGIASHDPAGPSASAGCSPLRRRRQQLYTLSGATAPLADCAHVRGTARLALAACGPTWSPVSLRPDALRTLQRGQALPLSAHTVEQPGDPLREARRQLPRDGGPGLQHPLAGIVIRQTNP